MNDAVPTQHFPRPILFLVAAVLVSTVGAAGYGRLVGSHRTLPDTPPLAERDLRFEDQPDGGVVVRDARDGSRVAIMAPGTNAFLRATLRGLAQQRMREELGPEVPFRLSAWPDGRLTLEDTTTHRTVELEAFGHSNAEVFAAFLPARGAAR